uniref:Uncharacterized protein n=1 Tax=Panagrellus redivivus TaxID=6233 RepID=A0A7E4VZM1_PANRE
MECLGGPPGEDYNCSDALTFKPEHYFQYTYAHRHYFEHKVTSWGKLGCSATHQEEEKLPSDATGPDDGNARKSNPWQAAVSKLRTVSSLFG